MHVQCFSHTLFFATPWTITHQTSPSMGFSRQKCWNGLPFPSSGDLPDPGLQSASPASPALQVYSLRLSRQRSTFPHCCCSVTQSWSTLCSPMDCNTPGLPVPQHLPSSQVALVGKKNPKNPPVNTGDIRDVGSLPGLERFPRGEHGNPPQYSCLENPMDRGA